MENQNGTQLQEETVMLDWKDYLQEFLEKNQEKMEALIAVNKNNIRLQFHYFLFKRVENALENLAQEQGKIIQDFKKTMKEFAPMRKHYPGQSNIMELSLRAEFERRMDAARKLWVDYIAKCKAEMR